MPTAPRPDAVAIATIGSCGWDKEEGTARLSLRCLRVLGAGGVALVAPDPTSARENRAGSTPQASIVCLLRCRLKPPNAATAPQACGLHGWLFVDAEPPVDDPLLGDGEDVVGQPIEHQAGREEED